MAKQWTPPADMVEEVNNKTWTPPADQVEVVQKKNSTPDVKNTSPSFANGGGLDLNSLTGGVNPMPLIPITDDKLRTQNRLMELQPDPIIQNAKALGKQNKANLQNNPPVQSNQKRGFLDQAEQALYLPAFNKGFNDLVVKPYTGAVDFTNRTINKISNAIVGHDAPEWLTGDGNGNDLLHNTIKYYDDAYNKRDKPTNLLSETAEGVMGTLPLMASLATGSGEASMATKAPHLVSKLTGLLATTKALSAYKDATDENKGYGESLKEAGKGVVEGGKEGLALEAQMMVGGALGKGVANKLAEKGLMVGGKASEAVLHALGVGTVFGGTSAGDDLMQGKDINTHEAMKQFGMGLAFELPGVAKGINSEIKDAVDTKRLNHNALQTAAVSNAASNLHGESVLRTLITTPKDQLLAINDNIKDGHEDLYANSIEQGTKAYEAKSPDEKKQLYTNQLLLKTQGDVKYVADKLSDPETSKDIVEQITNSQEIPDEQKADLIDKVQSLSKNPIPDEEPTPTTPTKVPLSEAAPQADTGNVPDLATQSNEINNEPAIANHETAPDVQGQSEQQVSAPINSEAHVETPVSDAPKERVRKTVEPYKDIRTQAEETHGKSTPESLAKEANSKTWYHGSNKDLTNEHVSSAAFTRPDSLLGLGFYMTDNPDIAEKYSNLRRNKDNSKVNEFSVKTSKLLDAEKPIDNDVADTYKRVFQTLFTDKADADEFFDDVKKHKPDANMMDYHKAIFEHIADEHIPTNDVTEHFQDLEASLKDELGYDGISHIGGKTLGGKEHNVMILLDPSGEYSDNRKPFVKKGLYDSHEDAPDVKEPELSHEDAVRQAIEKETDPKKIAAQYHTESSYPDHIEKGIIDYLGDSKINEKDYKRITGNDAPHGGISRWIDTKNSDKTDINTHAEILSHDLGVHVTPEDIVETIDRYTGRKNFIEANKSDTQKLLESRYEELTGKKLTARRAEKAHGSLAKELTSAQVEEFNKRAKEIGITQEDIDNYERARKQSDRGADKPRDAKPVKNKVRKPKDEPRGRKEESGGGESVGNKPKTQSLTEEELAEKKALRKKFAGVFNDITRIPTLLADKEFRRYASLIFKEAKGDFKAWSAEMIDSVGEKIKEHLPALFKELGGEETPSKKAEGGEVKKKVLTQRAYEGDISDDVKRHLEEKGLTRKSFTQEERSKQGTEFIKKFGEEAAFQAVESGDVEGGMAASVLSQLQKLNSRAMDKLAEGSEERELLAKKQADIISLMDKMAYSGGDFNGQLGFEYQDEELNYANVKKQVEKLIGRALTPAQDVKVKKLTTENERLRNKLKEAEAKLIDETDKVFSSDKPEAPVKPKTEYAKKALDAVVNVRAKIRANSYSDATGMVALVDSALGTIEASIRAGITVSKAIEKGIEHIKTELKKRGIDVWEKEDDFRKDVTSAFADEGVVDSSAEQDLVKKQQANIKRLEKELENAKNDRLKEAPTKREPSEEENRLKEQIKTEKLRISRENMQAAFVDKIDNKFTHSEAKQIWEYMKGEYLENGEPYKDALSKTAQDLGLSWRQVSEAITTPKNKRVSDEVWNRQAEYAKNNNVVKTWIGEQDKSDFYKLLKKVSGTIRGIQVFGHGHVFIGTHAGMTLFTPRTTATTIKAFFNGWKLAYGKTANYERAMEELKNSPNYVIAQRAGLKNNPDHINGEEYQKNQHFLGRLGTVGERGFNAIKVLRQNLFDHEYNKLSPAEQADPEVAKSIAHIMNLATGATTLKIPEAINEVTFAGGMEAARWQKLLGSPAKAVNTAYNALIHPEKATVADRVFAKIWARRVGQQLATYTTALLVNSAIQNRMYPNNPVNLTDPDKPDFFKFKFGDMTLDPTSGMRSTAAFIYKLAKVGFEDAKNLRGEKRSTVLGKDVAKYSLGKLAPLYGTLSDFYNRHDFNNNVMPFSNEKPASYAHKLTWGEYAWSKTMLPVAEAANVTYQSAFEHGANKVTLDNVLKGIMTGALSGATGFRVGEFDANAAVNNIKPEDKAIKKIKLSTGAEYELNDSQVAYRQKINEAYIKKNTNRLNSFYAEKATRDKDLLKKIKEETKDKSAEEKKTIQKELVNNYIDKKIKAAANKHSLPITYHKYKDSLKVVDE